MRKLLLASEKNGRVEKHACSMHIQNEVGGVGTVPELTIMRKH